MKNDEAIKKDRHRQYGDTQKPKGAGQKRRTGKLRRRLGKKVIEESSLHDIQITGANQVLASFGMQISQGSKLVCALPDETTALEDMSEDDDSELPESNTGG